MNSKLLLSLISMLAVINILNAQNKGLVLSDRSSRVTVSSMPVESADWTFETWVYLDELHESFTGIIDARDGTTTQALVLKQVDGKQYLGYEWGGSWTYTSEARVLLQQWTHVAMVISSTTNTASFYINGEKISEDNTYSMLGDSVIMGGSVRIGNGNSTDNRSILGKLDEVRIWSVARTESELKDNMLVSMDAGAQTGLVAYYNCDAQSDGDAVLNDTTNNYDAAITGPAVSFVEVDLSQTYDPSIATLESLSSSSGVLSPAFDPATDSYSLTLPVGASSINLTAIPEDINAIVNGAGIIDVTSTTDTIIEVIALDSTINTYSITFSFASSFEPIEGQVYTFIQKSSGMALGTDGKGGAQIKDKWGTDPFQRLMIIASDVDGEFYITADGSYLYRSITNDRGTGFTKDTAGISAECRWGIELGNGDTTYLTNPVTGDYLATDDIIAGSPVYHNEAISNVNAAWQLGNLDDAYIPYADTVYSFIQTISGNALGNNGGTAAVLAEDENDIQQRLLFVESEEQGKYFIITKEDSAFLQRSSANTWTTFFTEDTTGLTTNCKWDLLNTGGDTVFITNPYRATKSYIASDDIAAGSSVYYDKTIDNANGIFILKKLNKVIVPRSSDADLKSILLSSGDLSPAFDAATTAYTVALASGVAQVNVLGTVNDPEATVAEAQLVDVSSGSGSITLTVTAENGDTKDYTIDFTVAQSSDADLSGITLSVGTLSPAFAKATTSYTVTLDPGTTSVDVSATPNNEFASVAGEANVDVSGGSGSITLEVTAEDGSTNNYTVTFDVTVGVKDVLLTGVSVYPNPANNIMNVSNIENATISVYSLTGQLLLSSENVNQVNVSSLNKGLYMVKIQKDNKSFTTKLVVE